MVTSTSSELFDSSDQCAENITQTPLKEALKACRSAFWLMLFLTSIINLMGVVPTLYMMNMYDRVLSTQSATTMVSLTVLVIGIYLFWSALEWIRNRLMLRISLRIDWDLAAQAFDASFRRNAGRKKTNIQQIMGDLLVLRQFITGASLVAVMDAPFALIYIVVGGLIHPLLAVFALVVTLIVTALALLNRKVATPALKAANEASGEATRIAAQSVCHAETALAMGMLPAIRKRWHEKHRWFLQHQINGSEASGLMGWFSGVLMKLTPSLQMAVGIYLAIAGLITGGMVIAATFLINRSIAPLKRLISSWRDVVNARCAFDRLDSLLLEDQHRQQRMRLPSPQGKLVISKLQLVPPGSHKPVLSKIDFAIDPGQVLAIIGPNAAGKSSLLKAILGLWRPQEGSVRLDGVDVADWDHDELGPHIGYVAQDADLFEATVAENIARLGIVDSEKVVAAAKAVGMHEVILSFPKGYDTLLGDAGYALSGGLAQRIAIARALYGCPKLIVLDEPNSKLDETAELELMSTFRDLQNQGVTLIFSTHRPKLIAIADYLLVLRSGVQMQFGPVREILDRLKANGEDKVSAPSADKKSLKAANIKVAGGSA